MKRKQAERPAPYQPWMHSQVGRPEFARWARTQGVDVQELLAEQGADWAERQLEQLDAEYRRSLKAQAEQEDL